MTVLRPTGRIPVVVIGCGRMGRLHARTLARLHEFELVGLVDVDPAAGAFARTLAVPFHSEPAAARAARLAVIAVPSTAHAEVFRQAAALGLDCLVEKPVGATLDELQSMAQLAQDAGVRVFGGYSERFNPAMPRLMAALQRPAQRIVVRRLSSSALEREFDTDVMQDLLAHDLDWLMQALGAEPETATILDCRVHDGRIEEVDCHLRFAGGLQAQLRASRIAAAIERSASLTDVAGRRELFDLHDWRLRAAHDGLTAQARALAAAWRGEPSTIAQLDDALRVQRLLRRLVATLRPALASLHVA